MANPKSYIMQEKQKVFGSKTVTFPMEDRPHYMQLTFTEYVTTDPEVNKTKLPKDNIVKHIILPLPAQLADGYGIRHAGTEFGITGAMALRGGQVINNFLNDLDTKEGPSFGELKKQIEGISIGGAARAIVRRIASIDAGVSGAIDRTTGTALNPHLISVFEGVDLRSFDFSWKVYPQTGSESQEMQRVLKQIRRLIHPTNYQDDGKRDIFLIRYPHEVFATIWVEDKPLIRIGRSVIKNLAINYSPSGTPAFFKGTHDPVEIEFGIQMQEVAAMTQEDIDKLDDYPNRESLTEAMSENLYGSPF